MVALVPGSTAVQIRALFKFRAETANASARSREMSVRTMPKSSCTSWGSLGSELKLNTFRATSSDEFQLPPYPPVVHFSRRVDQRYVAQPVSPVAHVVQRLPAVQHLPSRPQIDVQPLAKSS